MLVKSSVGRKCRWPRLQLAHNVRSNLPGEMSALFAGPMVMTITCWQAVEIIRHRRPADAALGGTLRNSAMTDDSTDGGASAVPTGAGQEPVEQRASTSIPAPFSQQTGAKTWSSSSCCNRSTNPAQYRELPDCSFQNPASAVASHAGGLLGDYALPLKASISLTACARN